jgi:predicted nuclease of predicted toxin-antitoxin system
MRIRIDENLPASLAQILAEMGHDIETVAKEGLSGLPDSVVWKTAQDERRFLITQDLDFSSTALGRGNHAGLLLVRLRDPGRTALLAKVSEIFETEAVEEWAGCVVVTTDRKTRVRRAT